MRHNAVNEDSNSPQSNFSKNSPDTVGQKKELYLLFLLATVLGFSLDYWFNHHQLPWQSSGTPTKMSISAPAKSPDLLRSPTGNLLL